MIQTSLVISYHPVDLSATGWDHFPVYLFSGFVAFRKGFAYFLTFIGR
jgi:hypothetical protein